MPERTIVAHLRNGSSMVSLLEGAIETTMGITPPGGMMMGSRSRDLDPGIIVYLLRKSKMTPEQLSELVNRELGLKGVSGLTSDMRTLLEQREDDAAAVLSIDMDCYLGRKHIEGLAALLGGLDLLVFTGGVWENYKPIREEIDRELDLLQCVKLLSSRPTKQRWLHGMWGWSL